MRNCIDINNQNNIEKIFDEHLEKDICQLYNLFGMKISDNKLEKWKKIF